MFQRFVFTVFVGALVTLVSIRDSYAFESNDTYPEVSIVLGEEEQKVISGLDKEFPDCQVSFVAKSLFMSASNRSVLVSMDQKELSFSRVLAIPSQVESHGMFSWYLGFCSVIEMPDGSLWAFYQEEFRPNEYASDRFASQIGYAISTDGGNTFIVQGVFLQSARMWDRVERNVTGIGQPNAIIKDGYIYLFFTNWDMGSDAIYLARKEIDTTAAIEVWQGTQFEAIEDTILPEFRGVPVIVQGINEEHYAALAGVSYNTVAEGYLATYETECGFRYRVSSDLTTWGDEHRLLEFDVCKGSSTPNTIWRSYPMLLSFESANSSTTGPTAQLYYACRGPGDSTHTLCARDAVISN